ncbi:MAG: serine/threonine protein kinase [Myxococcota bacterium]
MPICPNCKTEGPTLLEPCPTNDGFYLVEEDVFAAHSGDRFLGREIANRFVVHSVLGRGSMGRVYRALQTGVDRDVALKLFESESILERSLGRSITDRELEDAQARFIQEARVLGKISHPNCVTVYDFGVGAKGKFMYMAMEYVAGVSLREAVNRKLKFPAIVEIARQVLYALRESHSLNIVHRDLKPENIILSYRFSSNEHVVKVLDFGIAKLLQGDMEARTSAGALFGTPAYMSPEQCRGEVESIGPAVDVYAFGCMLFEMVSGRLPFVAPMPQQMVRLHKEAPVPDLEPRRSIDLPSGFNEFVRTCLAKKPEDRYANAPEALAALETILGSPANSGLLTLDTRNLGSMADAIRDRSQRGHRPRSSVSVPDDHIAGGELDPVGRFGATPPSGAYDTGEKSDEFSELMSLKDTQPPSRDFNVGLGDEATDAGNDNAGLLRRDGSSPISRQTMLVVAAVLTVTAVAVLVFYFIYRSMMVQ